MACDAMQMVVLPWMLIAGKTSAGFFLPLTGWRTTDGVDEARSQGEMRGKVNTLTVTAYVQYANDVRSPAGQTAIGSSISADGMLDPTTATSLTTTLAGYRHCRFGCWVVGDNTNMAVAMMGGVIMVKNT